MKHTLILKRIILKMSNRLKTVLSIIALLAIGFLAGYQSHRYVVRNHLNKIARERISPGLQERMIQALQLDETQLPEVTPILEDFGKRLIQMRRDEVERRKPLLDSMEIALSEKLRPDQQEHLDQMMKRMKRIRENGSRKGKREKRRK